MAIAQPKDDNFQEPPSLGVSKFDQVSSILMAVFLFVGMAVFFMFLIWLLDNLHFRSPIVAAIVEEAAGRGDNAEGFERDFEPPGQEEVSELEEPTLTDTLQAVTDAVSSVAASLDSMSTDAAATTQGTGRGDSRPPGPEGEGEDIVPRYERWSLKFAASGTGPYAEQLDFYKIDLGAIGGSIQGVDIASNLSRGANSRRITDTSQEKRLYFRFPLGTAMATWNRQLLSKAGVNLSGGRYAMMFIPPNLENQLARMELDYAAENGRTSVTQIAKTVFESKESGGGYAFEITDQRYRKGK